MEWQGMEDRGLESADNISVKLSLVLALWQHNRIEMVQTMTNDHQQATEC